MSETTKHHHEDEDCLEDCPECKVERLQERLDQAQNLIMDLWEVRSYGIVEQGLHRRVCEACPDEIPGLRPIGPDGISIVPEFKPSGRVCYTKAMEQADKAAAFDRLIKTVSELLPPECAIKKLAGMSLAEAVEGFELRAKAQAPTSVHEEPKELKGLFGGLMEDCVDCHQPTNTWIDPHTPLCSFCHAKRDEKASLED